MLIISAKIKEEFLEQAFSAKELMEKGYKDAEECIINVGKALRTQSAQKLYKVLLEVPSNHYNYYRPSTAFIDKIENTLSNK